MKTDHQNSIDESINIDIDCYWSIDIKPIILKGYTIAWHSIKSIKSDHQFSSIEQLFMTQILVSSIGHQYQSINYFQLFKLIVNDHRFH